MLPHYGNRLERGPEGESLRGGKAVGYGAVKDPGHGEGDAGKAGRESDAHDRGERAVEYSSGGYQVQAYEPASYVISEYKSVYDS